MEMHWIDWSILGALFAGLLWLLLYCRKFVRNTADFLAANRCAERYILAIASGIGAVGAISIIAFTGFKIKQTFSSELSGNNSKPIKQAA